MKHGLRTVLRCLLLLVICVAETALLGWLVAMHILPRWMVRLVLFSIPFLLGLNLPIWRRVQSPQPYRAQQKRGDDA